MKKVNVIWIIAIVGLIFAVIPFILYFSQYHSGLSSSIDDWSKFGDFVGGVASPLLSFLSLLAVLFVFQHEMKLKREDDQRKNILTYFELLNQRYSKISLIENDMIFDGGGVFQKIFSCAINITTIDKMYEKGEIRKIPYHNEMILMVEHYSNLKITLYGYADLFVLCFDLINNENFYSEFISLLKSYISAKEAIVFCLILNSEIKEKKNLYLFIKDVAQIDIDIYLNEEHNRIEKSIMLVKDLLLKRTQI